MSTTWPSQVWPVPLLADKFTTRKNWSQDGRRFYDDHCSAPSKNIARQITSITSWNRSLENGLERNASDFTASTTISCSPAFKVMDAATTNCSLEQFLPSAPVDRARLSSVSQWSIVKTYLYSYYVVSTLHYDACHRNSQFQINNKVIRVHRQRFVARHTKNYSFELPNTPWTLSQTTRL